MKRNGWVFAAAALISLGAAGFSIADAPGVMYQDGPVRGRMVDAGFLRGETNYHAVQQASDGRVYFGIGSHAHGRSASLFRYDPRDGSVVLLGSMNTVTGEDGTKVFNQDKIHCDLYELDGKLYFSTQGGVYGGGDYGPYPGGHFFSCDLSTGKIADLGIGPRGEGIITMAMDSRRGRLYGITWPGMLFLTYDIGSGTIRNFGKRVETPGIGDLTAVPGNRSLGVDPRTGNVYWHNMDGTISRYAAAADTVELLVSPRLDLPVFRVARSGFSAVLWRAIRWNDARQCFYGIETNAEYLFSYEPERGGIEVIDRIASGPNRRSGNLGAANLAFELGPDGNTVYYIAGAVTRLASGESRRELHLVTYDLAFRAYTDHGPILLDDGRYPSVCSGLDVGRDGNLYLVCTIPLAVTTDARAQRIVAARFANLPPEKLPGAPYEVNLVVIPDPLRK